MAEPDETQWRMEPLGWDSEDREYIVLDDDRLYRRTEPPLPPEPKAKAKPKAKKSRNMRSNKRRRMSRKVVEDTPEEEEDNTEVNDTEEKKEVDVPYDGWKWELIAVTLQEYNDFIDSHRKSKDPNEKALCKRLKEDVIPVLLEKAEEREREALRRAKELQNMEKLATAKRSSRLAGKAEKEKEKKEIEDAERKHREDLEMAHKEQLRMQKMEQDRQSRMMTREQRVKEREVKRILQEEQLTLEKEQLAKLEELGEDADLNGHRMSERHLKNEVKRRQLELESLQQSEEEWVFDCAVCGMYGQNYDDGTLSIACDKCNVWQHSACHGITREQAERDDFQFKCRDCKQRMENPIPPIKLKFGASPKAQKEKTETGNQVAPALNGAGLTRTSPALVPMSAQLPPPMNGTRVQSGEGQGQIPRHAHNYQAPLSPSKPSVFADRKSGATVQEPREVVTSAAPGVANQGSSGGLGTNGASQSHLPTGRAHPAPQNGFYHQQFVQATTQSMHPQHPHPPSMGTPAAHRTQHPPFAHHSYQQSSPGTHGSDTYHQALPNSSPSLQRSQAMGYSPISTASPKTSFPPPQPSPSVVRAMPVDNGLLAPSSTPAPRSGQNSIFARDHGQLLHGSSPGYSPEKHSPLAVTPAANTMISPLSQRKHSMSGPGAGSIAPTPRNPTIPPISLSPNQRPPVLSPPVKGASPDRASLLNSVPALQQQANAAWDPKPLGTTPTTLPPLKDVVAAAQQAIPSLPHPSALFAAPNLESSPGSTSRPHPEQIAQQNTTLPTLAALAAKQGQPPS